MSYVFTVNGPESQEWLWSPALSTGKLFLSIVECLAEGAEFAGQETGFVMNADDHYFVDPPTLAAFVQSVLTSSVVASAECKELARGAIVACLVMLDRAGVPMEPPDESQRDLFDGRAAMAREMAT